MAALPAFNPDLDGHSPALAVVELRHHICTSEALLFSTPEYAGDLPGSFKNLLNGQSGMINPDRTTPSPGRG
jgi:chromate reductase, NAD(P)H dehydrogenase (quinone)